MRLATSQRFVLDGSWVAPAGVTRVLAIPDGGVGILLTVTPNTSYSLVVETAPGSFGSLYDYQTNPITGFITLVWMD